MLYIRPGLLCCIIQYLLEVWPRLHPGGACPSPWKRVEGAVEVMSVSTRTGGYWAGRVPSIGLLPCVGAVEAGLVAGGSVFQALMVAAGVGPGSQAYDGGQAACRGSRSGCGCQSGLPGLRRGACGDRNLLRPCCGCGARRVRGSGVQASGCA